MTKEERMKEIAKASPDFGKGVGYKMCVVDELHDMKELLEENAELKAYNEKLLNGDIEKHNKIVELEEENKELKTRVENQKSFLERIRAKFNLGELERKEIEGYLTNEQLIKAKELLKRLIETNNPVYFDEDRQRFRELKIDAEQFLKECE